MPGLCAGGRRRASALCERRRPDDGIGVPLRSAAEIALLAGVSSSAAAPDASVVLDGFITGAAALVAAQVEPASVDAMIASHRRLVGHAPS